MRFTLQREAFLKPMKIVSGVVERRHAQSIPILANVLVRVVGEQFFLTTTDQEVELIAGGLLEEEQVVEGSVTLPVRKILDICRALPEGAILSFTEEKDRIVLRSNRSRFALSILPAKDFPELESHLEGVHFSLSQRNLRTLIEKVYFAMAEQDVRYYLNGMLLEIKNGNVFAVASDGHRMAVNKIKSLVNNEANMRVIVPRKGILELLRLLGDTDEQVTVLVGTNHIRVTTEEVTLTSKLIDGRFPDYERIIPKGGKNVVVAHRESMREALLRAAAVLNDKFRGVILNLSSHSLKISASNPEQDEVEENLEVDYAGQALEISFNVKYLLDVVNVVQTALIRFTFIDSNNSTRVEGVGEEEGAVYVIMPMRI
jgi:DNA polymerase-3 subunit beta